MVTNNSTFRGEHFEKGQLNNIMEAVGISDKHRALYLAGDFNLDMARAKGG